MTTNGRHTTNGKHTAPVARNVLGGPLKEAFKRKAQSEPDSGRQTVTCDR